MIAFSVYGTPRPKQSFRYRSGGGYTPAIVKAWQNEVSRAAREEMCGRYPLEGILAVDIEFYLPDRRRRDLDNLSKAVLDAMNEIVFKDDQQVIRLKLYKCVSDRPRIEVSVEEM